MSPVGEPHPRPAQRFTPAQEPTPVQGGNPVWMGHRRWQCPPARLPTPRDGQGRPETTLYPKPRWEEAATGQDYATGTPRRPGPAEAQRLILGGALGSPSSLHCRQPPSWPLPFPSPWFISCPTRPLHPDQPADRSPGSSEPAAPDRGAAGSTPRVADHGALGGTPSSWGCQRQPGDRTPGALRTFLQFVITGDTQYKDEIVQTESAQLYQEGGRGQ